MKSIHYTDMPTLQLLVIMKAISKGSLPTYRQHLATHRQHLATHRLHFAVYWQHLSAFKTRK